MPGQEYSHKEQRCQSCPIGYYNDDLDPARYACIMCNVDYITANEGATSVRDCNIRESVCHETTLIILSAHLTRYSV